MDGELAAILYTTWIDKIKITVGEMRFERGKMGGSGSGSCPTAGFRMVRCLLGTPYVSI